MMNRMIDYLPRNHLILVKNEPQKGENMKKLNLQKISKTITSLALVCMLILGHAASVSAAENNNSDVPTVTPEIVAEELGISLNEAENLEQNLNKAVVQLPNLEVGDSATVPVSENLVLEAETHDDGQIMNPLTKATNDRTITATLKLKNIFGGTVVTLTAVGVFRTNGSTSKPIDAYGTHSAIVWNVTAKKAVKGSSAYNAYVRNTFTGKFNIGIDPVNMTVQSFTYTCTTYCNAKGVYSASWR